MPQNGETNQKFGFFKNQCCGKEIALTKGSEFPSCPNHPGVTTSWVPIVDRVIVELVNRRRSERPPPKFKVGDVVTFVGIGTQHGNQGDITEVIIEGSIDNVQRFHVRFNDGTWIECFGFELELFEGKSSTTA